MSWLWKLGEFCIKALSLLFFFEVLKEINKVFNSFEEEMDHYKKEEKSWHNGLK